MAIIRVMITDETFEKETVSILHFENDGIQIAYVLMDGTIPARTFANPDLNLLCNELHEYLLSLGTPQYLKTTTIDGDTLAMLNRIRGL